MKFCEIYNMWLDFRECLHNNLGITKNYRDSKGFPNIFNRLQEFEALANTEFLKNIWTFQKMLWSGFK